MESVISLKEHIKVLISHAPKLQQEGDFWRLDIFHHALSRYLSKSHNLTNSNIYEFPL